MALEEPAPLGPRRCGGEDGSASGASRPRAPRPVCCAHAHRSSCLLQCHRARVRGAARHPKTARSARERLLRGRGPHQSRHAAVPPAQMVASTSRSTPRMGALVQHVLDSHPSVSTGVCREADVPHVPSLSRAGDRHGILPQEACPLDAVELSVCEAGRARRWGDTTRVRRRAGGLAHGPHPCWSATSGMACLPVRCLSSPVAACGAIEASPRPQPCLTRTPGLHPSNAGADGGQGAPGTVATPSPGQSCPEV